MGCDRNVKGLGKVLSQVLIRKHELMERKAEMFLSVLITMLDKHYPIVTLLPTIG